MGTEAGKPANQSRRGTRRDSTSGIQAWERPLSATKCVMRLACREPSSRQCSHAPHRHQPMKAGTDLHRVFTSAVNFCSGQTEFRHRDFRSGMCTRKCCEPSQGLNRSSTPQAANTLHVLPSRCTTITRYPAQLANQWPFVKLEHHPS